MNGYLLLVNGYLLFIDSGGFGLSHSIFLTHSNCMPLNLIPKKLQITINKSPMTNSSRSITNQLRVKSIQSIKPGGLNKITVTKREDSLEIGSQGFERPVPAGV